MLIFRYFYQYLLLLYEQIFNTNTNVLLNSKKNEKDNSGIFIIVIIYSD